MDLYSVWMPVGEHRVCLHTPVVAPAALSIAIDVYQNRYRVAGMEIDLFDIQRKIDSISTDSIQCHILQDKGGYSHSRCIRAARVKQPNVSCGRPNLSLPPIQKDAACNLTHSP